MAIIKPFKAVRPPRDKAYLVGSRPYYSYKKKILEAKLKSNPYTFLHVINPEFQKEDKTLPNSSERFQKVKDMYDVFLEKEYYKKDNADALYIYRQQIGEEDFLGIIAGASVQEYLDGHIKIHEHTITQREQTFKRYLDICNFNAEPVLLTYKDHKGIAEVIEKYTITRSEYEFTSTDQRTHNLWVVDNQEDIELLQKYFNEVADVYIADGHHRTSSSVLYAKDKNAAKNEEGLHNYFLSFFIAESKLKIFDYNRVVTELNGLSEELFLEQLQQDFVIEKLRFAKKPSRGHEFTMLLGEQYFKLKPKKGVVDHTHPVKCLDAQILSDFILDPILGIKNLKTDERILFVEGTKGIKGLKQSMRKNNAKVAFALYPVSIEELKRVADNNLIMPPKSTWIEPKMRSGLTIYEY